jgi:hypothetical protein
MMLGIMIKAINTKPKILNHSILFSFKGFSVILPWFQNLCNKNPGTGFVIRTLPIPGFVSVVGLGVLRLPGDGIQFAPGLPLGKVQFALFLLGKLFVGNKFFHHSYLLTVCISITYAPENA